MNHAAAAVRRRAVLLWLAVTAGTLGVAVLAGPQATALAHGPAGTFADLLVQLCAVAALGATALLWTTATDVVRHQLRAPGRPLPGRRVGPLRAALLAACGVAVLATPAAASDGTDRTDGPASPLAGLPLPDRPVGGLVTPASPGPARSVEVRPGDSLWTVAARTLGPDASTADVASYWRRLRALNADAVGPDPDLVHPGLRLRLPPQP